jgi:recombination protein RecA
MTLNFDTVLDDLREVVGMEDAGESIPYWLNTSLPNVNLAISGQADRGFPGGRIVIIAGPESCGKTALATELMVEAQRQGGFAFTTDFEHAFLHSHAESIGLSTGKGWYYRKPNYAEEGFEIAYKVMRTLRASELGITLPADSAKNPTASADALRAALKKRGNLEGLMPIVGLMDSIASMIPREQDIDYVKQNMKSKNMSLAQMLSIELKRLARDADNNGTTMILLNQLRTNPGVMFGDSTTEPGGAAPRFYASIMIRLRRTAKWRKDFGDEKSEAIGDVVELYVRKNKVARPFRKTKYVFRTIDPVGLDLVGTMIMLGKEAGVLGPVEGKTVEFNGKKRWSISDFDAQCRADAGLRKQLVDHVMATVNPVTEGPVIEDEDEDEVTLPEGTLAFTV